MKAAFKLSNGTMVEVDGDPDEIQRMLSHFTSRDSIVAGEPPIARKRKSVRRDSAAAKNIGDRAADNDVSEIELVNWIKEQGSAPWIDAILDSRDVTRRVLLPLYAAEKVGLSDHGITSGFISRVLAQLGVRISVPNVSTELSGKAKRFVLAGSVRRKGTPVNYKISRAGLAMLDQTSRV